MQKKLLVAAIEAKRRDVIELLLIEKVEVDSTVLQTVIVKSENE